MMNAFIRRILQKPGRYMISNLVGLARGAYFCIEVDDAGRAWQLDPEGERDGELRPEGWIGNEIVIDVRAAPEDEAAFKQGKSNGHDITT